MKAAPTVLIMGPPGAGKGTQSSHLVTKYGLKHVSTGDLLREAVSRKTPLGVEAQNYMDEGNLVPDELIIEMIKELVSKLDDSTGVLLDGFPRTEHQAEALDEMLREFGREVDVALDITVLDSTLIERLSSRWICRVCSTPYNVVSNPPKVEGVCDLDAGELYQRSDDTESAVKNRLEVYERQTAPVADHYRAADVLIEVDGDDTPSAVRASLDDAMMRVHG